MVWTIYMIVRKDMCLMKALPDATALHKQLMNQSMVVIL